MGTINIKGLDKGEILAGLYNNSKPLGIGVMNGTPEDMTVEEANRILKTQTDFDYIQGRVMKVNLSKDEFDPWLYDRDIGEGSAERIVDEIRRKNNGS